MIGKQNTKDIFILCCFLCAVGDFNVNTHLIKNTKAATFAGHGVPRATGHRERFFFCFFFPKFCCRTFLQAVIMGSCWTLFHLPLDEEKHFFPNGQIKSPLNSTLWKNLKAKLYLLEFGVGGGGDCDHLEYSIHTFLLWVHQIRPSL